MSGDGTGLFGSGYPPIYIPEERREPVGRVQGEIAERLLDDPDIVSAIAYGADRGKPVIDLIKRVRDITIQVKDEVLDD